MKGKVLLTFPFLLMSLAAVADPDPPNLTSALKTAATEKLADDPVWHALLQIHPDSKRVDDPHFYLSEERTPQSELLALVRQLYSAPTESVLCRFPARSLWLQRKLNLASLPFESCPDLQGFLRRAPAENISLVFAAENISQPSSSMGHVFLKITGLNQDKIPVAHMISFFTDAHDVNVPKLIWETLIVGRKSYYALTPYEENKNYYLFREQRSLWEYQLKLNPDQKQLVHFYLYEIHRTSFSYYFHIFNCATLVRNILSVAWPRLATRNFWITPLDIVRAVDRPEYVQGRAMIPSSKWKVNTLLTQLSLSSTETKEIAGKSYSMIDTTSPSPERSWLALDLASAYNDYLYEEDRISIGEWRSSTSFLDQQKARVLPGATKELSGVARPSLTQQDSQVFLREHNYLNQDLLILGFLPAAHALEDDSSQYLNQWELKMGEISGAWAPKKGQWDLNSLILYSVISYAPTNRLIPAYSSLLRIGFERRFDDDLSERRSPFLEFGGGKTWRLHPAVDLHLMLRAGYQPNLHGETFFSPDLGLRAQEAAGWQSEVALAPEYRFNSKLVSIFSFSQILNTPEFGLSLNYKHLFSSSFSGSPPSEENFFQFTVKHFF